MNQINKILNFFKKIRLGRKAKIAAAAFVVTLGFTGSYLQQSHNIIGNTFAPLTTKNIEGTTGSGNPIADEFVAEGNSSSGSKKSTDQEKSESTNETDTDKEDTPESSGTSSGRTGSSTSPKPATTSSTANNKFGMSAPANLWDERLTQVGASHINYRRIFYKSFDDSLTKVSEALKAGMTPVISWKTGSYSWSQVANGSADSKLNSLVTRLNAIPGKKVLVVHHEPAGDGTAADYVAMQKRALPILKKANQASVGIIGNGWWWSARSQGYSDAELAQWIPNSLKSICDVIAADTYQDSGLVEDGSVKAARLAAWAKRTGGVKALGIGEFNGYTASSITNVMNVVKKEALFKWALVWNSGTSGMGTPLEGARLQAFIKGKSTPNQT